MSRARLRVAAFGSPGFALPTLEMLRDRHELLLVVTQPDKRAGRGMNPAPPAAARWAADQGVPLAQPARLRQDDAFRGRLHELDLDVAVTAAYGKILPPSLLAIPRHGFLNVHASLLPAYRGAAPVQWALIDGCEETGVSIMQTEAGLDTGPVRLARRLRIRPDHDARTLLDDLGVLGARTLEEALDLLAEGRLPSEPQDDALATVAPMLRREDGRVRWHDAGRAIVDRHRGVAAWPGSWTVTPGGDVLKVHHLDVGDGGPTAVPGTIVGIDRRSVRVTCGDGTIDLLEVQAPGRKRSAAPDWIRGARVEEGARLG